MKNGITPDHCSEAYSFEEITHPYDTRAAHSKFLQLNRYNLSHGQKSFSYARVLKVPWYMHHGKKHGIHGETMVSPCFPCFPMLCKAWRSMESMGIFSGHISRAWISMETMGHHLIVILNSMEKHEKHCALFSHNFRQHGKACMGSMVTPYFHHFK